MNIAGEYANDWPVGQVLGTRRGRKRPLVLEMQDDRL